MTKVDITTAGHTIIVESDDDLDTVAAKALDLWRATRDPRLDRAAGPSGFHIERAEPTDGGLTIDFPSR
ncbi:hypothetical protein OOK41_09130 [Micromonospora sp. NBC_01655]|uniref:hypothetical protein n=1 Tax=Micromonospora sp. NBC_01655 TaxID=2975983 RepID=UPI002258913B|nr:hypothetical protein [Micromonospora sp. NBC_01655]MCX4470468.1 hypothetical protein [Micromonospora sp. NBC_01655]